MLVNPGIDVHYVMCSSLLTQNAGMILMYHQYHFISFPSLRLAYAKHIVNSIGRILSYCLQKTLLQKRAPAMLIKVGKS